MVILLPGKNWVSVDNLRIVIIPVHFYVPLEYDFSLKYSFQYYRICFLLFNTQLSLMKGYCEKTWLKHWNCHKLKWQCNQGNSVIFSFVVEKGAYQDFDLLPVWFWVVFLQNAIRGDFELAFIPSATSPHIDLLMLLFHRDMRCILPPGVLLEFEASYSLEISVKLFLLSFPKHFPQLLTTALWCYCVSSLSTSEEWSEELLFSQ